MDAFTNLSWQQYPAIVIVLFGMGLFWRGLRGGPHGERGLLRRGVSMLERVEGWRLALLGLTLAGAGLGWLWDETWLLILSLGIGFVEIQEATHIIKAWRWDGGTTRTRPTSAQPEGRGRPI